MIGSVGVSSSSVYDIVHPAMDKTALLCLMHGERWMEPRARVYELLLLAGAPVKAYELMKVFREGSAPGPPAIYRALEFLENWVQFTVSPL